MYIPPVSLSSDFTAIVTGPFTGHYKPLCSVASNCLDIYNSFLYSGVGYEVSKYLALLGARVILAGNSEIRGKAVCTAHVHACSDYKSH